MNESLCKIISSLNSNEVRACLESLGYTYNIAPLKHYNTVIRHKYTLDYNIKIFNATKDQINTISLAMIKKVFNDKYIRQLINHNICMLSYSFNDVKPTTSEALTDIRNILSKYLGKAKYTYVLNDSILKLVIDIPPNKVVSLWKPTLKKKESSIILDLMNEGINIDTIDMVFSYEDEELDDVANAFLELGYFIKE